jgi:Putative zinc-finger/HEAT repeats
MKCERAGELLPDYLEGALAKEDSKQLEEHLDTCAQCAKEAALARELAVLPIEEPSPVLRARFEAVLEAYEEGRKEGSRIALEKERAPMRRGWDWLRSPAVAMAATAVLLAAGFLGGRYASNQNDTHSQAQLASMESELTGMRQFMVISLLQEESASERLQGVSMTTHQDADPQILSALLHTLRYDSSVDVRLAALDALSRNGSRPQVRQGLVEALGAEQSPLVQVQLIDLLVGLRDRSVVDQLRKIEQDANTDPAVRQRAQRAIDQLS